MMTEINNANPKLYNNRNRKKKRPKKRKLRGIPELGEEEMARAHLQLKSYLVARKSNLERGRTDAEAKLEVKAIQGYLDYLRNLDKDSD